MFPVNKRYKWQNYIYHKIMNENAVSEATAKTLEELGLLDDSILEGLVIAGVIGKVEEKYYLNEKKATNFFRRRTFLTLFGIILLVICIITIVVL